MPSPPHPFATAASCATACVPTLDTSYASPTSLFLDRLTCQAVQSHACPRLRHLLPITSQLLPVSDLGSLDLDRLDSPDLHPSQGREQEQVHEHELNHKGVRHGFQSVEILSLEQVSVMNAVRSWSRPGLGRHQDQGQGDHGRDHVSEQQDTDTDNFWAPPPMRRAALKARNAKTFADGDDNTDDTDCELDLCSNYDDESESESDFEPTTSTLKSGKGKGEGKGPARRPCTTQSRTAYAVPPHSSRPHTASTGTNFFSCQLAPRRPASPLHPEVPPSLNPRNLITSASPLPSLARAILGPLAPLTLNIVARFEASAEKERQEAVGGLRLASYEEMILEALLTQEAAEEAEDEFDGLVPKDMYAYMTSRYPTMVPPNFRGSATQALKKAMRKGLVNP